MTRDEIKIIAEELGFDLDAPDTLDIFLDDVFYEFGMRPDAPMLIALIKAITSGTSTYSYETDMLQVVYAIMFDELLSSSSEAGLEAYSKTWRTDTGTPIAFTQDRVTARQYRLYPEPDFTSDPLIPLVGQPWGEDYPDDTLALIYSDNRESNIPDIFALPTAFDALAREFSYPSDHTDNEFAEVCRNLAQIFYTLTGVP
jgi:hypothetical protein